MDERFSELLVWLDTFQLPCKCASISDFSDGFLFSFILHQALPDDFPPPSDNSVEFNSSSNRLHGIARSLEDFYESALQRHLKLIRNINCTNGNTTFSFSEDEMWSFVDAIIGAIVFSNCVNLIEVMQCLPETTQTVLSQRIEIINSSCPIDDSLYDTVFDGALDSSSYGDCTTIGSNVSTPNSPVKCMISRIYDISGKENYRLSPIVNRNSHHLGQLKSPINSNKRSSLNSIQVRLDEYMQDDYQSWTGCGSSEKTLLMEMTNLRREMDLKSIEFAEIEQSLKDSKLLNSKYTETISSQSIEIRQLMNEVDLLRNKENEVIELRRHVELLQSKLDDIPKLKAQNKELNSQLDKYLDNLHQSENSNKVVVSSQKAVIEQLKQKINSLENDCNSVVVHVQLQNNEIQLLKEENSKLRNEAFRSFSQFEILRLEMETLRDKIHVEKPMFSVSNDNELFFNTIAPDESKSSCDGNLNQNECARCQSLEYDICQLLSSLKTFSSSSSLSFENNVDSDTFNPLNSKLTELYTEIGDLKKEKSEFELKLQLIQNSMSEVQAEIQLLRSTLERSQKHELELKLSLVESNESAQLLEEMLREKEGTISRLEQEKQRLENYAKTTLTAFKDKYLGLLNEVKEEKLKDELCYKKEIERYKQSEEFSRQEERLLLSVVYEIGNNILDSNINKNYSNA